MTEPGSGSGRDCDVLIIGAGPTGLLAAVLLKRLGAAVRIVDKAPGPAKESRAFAVQSRTVEIMLSIGLADRLIDRGTLMTGARVYVDGKVSGGVDLDLVGRADTPFPIGLIIPQSDVEAVLAEELATLGMEVERGSTCTSLVPDDAGVTVGVEPSASIRASYVIGADGAHSFVRKALGLSFEGAPYAQSFLLADCTVEGPIESGPMQVFFHKKDFALFFPLRDGRFGRIITTEPEADHDSSVDKQGTAPASLDEVEASFRRASQRDIRLVNPTWTSRYRVHHRGVNRYAVGRVFVAGDAAHIHSPAGGQGMNTGLQDVANLAWKLKLALDGRAPAGLLGSYDAERRPVGEAVLNATDKVFSLVTAMSGWKAVARDILVPLVGATMIRSGTMRNRAFHLLSGLGIRYEASDALASEAQGTWGAGPAPGRRAPDAAIARHRTIFDLLDGYRFNLLALSRVSMSEAEIDTAAGGLAALAARVGAGLQAHLVGHSLVGRHPGLIQIETSAALAAYGLGREVGQALYLVRPDGYVAWRAPSFDLDACERFVREYLVAAA